MKEKRFCTTLLHRVLLRALLTSRKKNEMKACRDFFMNATFVIHFLSTPYRKSHRACRDISSCVQQVVICKHTRTNASACTQNRWEDHLKNEVKDKRSSCMTLLRRVLLPALLTQERKANKWKHAEILFIDVIFAVLTQIPVNTERVGGNDRDSGRKSSGP